MSMAHKVLVVDDENKSCRFISDLIRSVLPDVEISVANHPFTALEMVDQHEYDMIFTDIRMPQMDGLEMIRQIKAKRKNPFVAIISAYTNFEYAQTAMEHGASGYILKPFNRERVEHIIHLYLEKKRQAKEPERERVILLNKSNGTYPVKVSEIAAIERSEKNMLTIYGLSFEKTQCRGTLLRITEQLPASFMRANRQMIINQHAIQSFNVKTQEICISTQSETLSCFCSRQTIRQIMDLF